MITESQPLAWNQLGDSIEHTELSRTGWSASISSNGNIVAVGSTHGSQIGGGGVGVYEWNGTSWVIKDSLIYQVSDYYDSVFGIQTSLSSDGNLTIQTWQTLQQPGSEKVAQIFSAILMENGIMYLRLYGAINYAGKVVLSGSGNYLINGHPSESEANALIFVSLIPFLFMSSLVHLFKMNFMHLFLLIMMEIHLCLGL